MDGTGDKVGKIWEANSGLVGVAGSDTEPMSNEKPGFRQMFSIQFHCSGYGGMYRVLESRKG